MRRGLWGAAPPPEVPGPPVSRGRPRPGPPSSSAPSRPCPGSPCYRPSLSRSCPRPLTPALGTPRRWGCPWTPGRRAGLRGGHRTGQLVRDQVEAWGGCVQRAGGDPVSWTVSLGIPKVCKCIRWKPCCRRSGRKIKISVNSTNIFDQEFGMERTSWQSLVNTPCLQGRRHQFHPWLVN